MNRGSLLSPDVLVIGAGPAGVALAIGLKRKGLNVLLVEKQSAPQKVFKGEYLQPSATAFLQKMNFSHIFNQPSCEFIKELRFRDFDSSDKVLSELTMEYPAGAVATSISHYELISALRKHAQEELGESFITGAQLKIDKSSERNKCPRFTFKNKAGEAVTIKPKWTVGCDGRNSLLRKFMGGNMLPPNLPVTIGAGEEVIVGAEIATPPPVPYRYEVLRFYEAGTLSSFSLGSHGQRLYFSQADENDRNVSQNARKKIQSLVQKAKRYIDLGEVTDTSPVLAFPAYGAWFGAVCKGNALLAGDAAGVTSPYGGQGMTAAYEHVIYLLENFDFTVSQSSRAGVRQLNNYANNVRAIYKRISLLNFGLYFLFFSRQPAFKFVSSYVIGVWNDNADLKKRVVRLFAGLDTDQPHVLELFELWGITKLPFKQQLQQLRNFTLRF